MGTRSHTPLVTFARRAGRRVLVAVASVPSTIGWTGAVVSAVLIVAAYLRLKGVSWGLPYNYQDPDEKVVLCTPSALPAATSTPSSSTTRRCCSP